jgi:hypothetical protein
LTFFRVSVEAPKKKVAIQEAMAIFKREIFLNIEKNRNSLAVKIAEKKGRWLTNFRFFFCQTKLQIPRCARYAWRK